MLVSILSAHVHALHTSCTAVCTCAGACMHMQACLMVPNALMLADDNAHHNVPVHVQIISFTQFRFLSSCQPFNLIPAGSSRLPSKHVQMDPTITLSSTLAQQRSQQKPFKGMHTHGRQAPCEEQQADHCYLSKAPQGTAALSEHVEG